MIGAMASHVPADAPADVSPGGAAWASSSPVPPYSQQLHRGEYLHWDRGGRSWCSPTSMSMLLAYHDRLPEPGDYAWVQPDYPNPFVVQAARHVYDYAYKGAGNWSFNTAYAGRHGAEAFVTRLRSLDRGRGVHRRGRAAGRDGVVQRERAGRRRLRDRRAPAHHRRVHRRRRRDLQRPGVPHDPEQRRGPRGVRPRAVRAGVARLVAAASSTSCTPTPYPSLLPRTPPNPTGDLPAAFGRSSLCEPRNLDTSQRTCGGFEALA